MKKTEIIIASLSIIALALNLLLIPGGSALTVVMFSMLTSIYFYLGFALFNDIRLRKIFKKDSYKEISSLRILGAIAAGIALSLTTIGLMFKFMSWPGAMVNLSIGLLGLVIVTIVGLVKYSKNKSNYYTKIFKRAAIFGGIGFIIILSPKSSIVELKYRNHPAYIEAYKKAVADPENEELWDKVKEESKKIHDNK